MHLQTFIILLVMAVSLMSTWTTTMAVSWEIQEPKITFQNLEYSLRFSISSQIKRNQIRYSMYDGLGCQVGANELFVLGYPYLFSEMSVSLGGQHDHQYATVFVKLNQQEITASPIFHPYDNDVNATDATVAFCVRFSLYTDQDNNAPQPPIEVNFLEIFLELDVTFRDGLYVHMKDEIAMRQLSDSAANTTLSLDQMRLRGSTPLQTR